MGEVNKSEETIKQEFRNFGLALEDYVDVKLLENSGDDEYKDNLQEWADALSYTLIPSFLVPWYARALAFQFPLLTTKQFSIESIASLGIHREVHQNAIMQAFNRYHSSSSGWSLQRVRVFEYSDRYVSLSATCRRLYERYQKIVFVT